jgi:hypothetical protein
MKRAIVLAVFFVGLVGIAVMNDQAGVAQAIDRGGAADRNGSPVCQLGWLVGGVWTADATEMGNGMKRIETRYVWSDNDAFIRFTTHFISNKETMKTYDGNFFWEPEKSQLAMWYMDFTNEIVQGPVTIDGETTKLSFRAKDFQAQMADMRVRVIRKTNDKYQWQLEEKFDDKWRQLAALEYLRTQNDPAAKSPVNTCGPSGN